MAVNFVKTGAAVIPQAVTMVADPPVGVPAPRTPQLVVPPRVECVEDTGIESGFIADLILKIVYFHSIIPGGKIAEVLRLPFSGVVDGLVDDLKIHHFVEVQGTDSPLRVTYKYALTDKGFTKVDAKYYEPVVELIKFIDSLRKQKS